jgi:hypothetical protein
MPETTLPSGQKKPDVGHTPWGTGGRTNIDMVERMLMQLDNADGPLVFVQKLNPNASDTDPRRGSWHTPYVNLETAYDEWIVPGKRVTLCIIGSSSTATLPAAAAAYPAGEVHAVTKTLQFRSFQGLCVATPNGAAYATQDEQFTAAVYGDLPGVAILQAGPTTGTSPLSGRTLLADVAVTNFDPLGVGVYVPKRAPQTLLRSLVAWRCGQDGIIMGNNTSDGLRVDGVQSGHSGRYNLTFDPTSGTLVNGMEFKGCRFFDAGTANVWAQSIDSTNSGKGVVFDNCQFMGPKGIMLRSIKSWRFLDSYFEISGVDLAGPYVTMDSGDALDTNGFSDWCQDVEFIGGRANGLSIPVGFPATMGRLFNLIRAADCKLDVRAEAGTLTASNPVVVMGVNTRGNFARIAAKDLNAERSSSGTAGDRFIDDNGTGNYGQYWDSTLSRWKAFGTWPTAA